MAGPLTDVDTLIAGINLDISRQLRYGDNVVMRFYVPDSVQFDKLRTVLVLLEGFDRMTEEEKGMGPSHKVVFKVADVTGELAPIIEMKDLMVEIEDDGLFQISQVPLINPNQAQVYTINCRTQNIRKNFDNTAK